MDKNQEGMCDEEENVDTGEENTEDEEVFEVAIEGDGDCFYSSIVEAFRREGVSLCSLELKSSTKSLVTGVKCLRLCVTSALTPETFEVLQQHQQVLLMFFRSFLSSQIGPMSPGRAGGLQLHGSRDQRRRTEGTDRIVRSRGFVKLFSQLVKYRYILVGVNNCIWADDFAIGAVAK